MKLGRCATCQRMVEIRTMEDDSRVVVEVEERLAVASPLGSEVLHVRLLHAGTCGAREVTSRAKRAAAMREREKAAGRGRGGQGWD